MYSNENKENFSEILDELGHNLDISQTQYDNIVKSYQAVGQWLAEKGALVPYEPLISPQGSFLLGTVIKPVCEEDDIDIDLVCELKGKKMDWTQADLKRVVGDRLKENTLYAEKLVKEGRRCWTLKYADSANYHLDVLPAIVSSGYSCLLEKAFADNYSENLVKDLAIRITDKHRFDYKSETNPDLWLKSNPFGYASWFVGRARIDIRKTVLLSDAVNPVPGYTKDKLPLQRAVQILKRHRDILFDGSEDKPISIIITTLSAKAYRKETNVSDALINIVNTMEDYIEDRYDEKRGRTIKWVSNPVNSEENFADKWQEYPQRQENFYSWLEKVKNDLNEIIRQQGLYRISDAMVKPFGENLVKKTFSNLAEKAYTQRQNGELKMKTGSGILGSAGTIVTQAHNFHGCDEW